MWKKDDVRTEPFAAPQTDAPHRDIPQTPERAAPMAASSGASPARNTGERATIGRSITIRGDVTGEEDLLIQGRVEGSVDLKKQSVTVGPEGEVRASIVGRVVVLEGLVEGNVTADEQVILRSSAYVQGDIAAPRVVLENGARFRGGIDMGDMTERNARTGGTAATPSKKLPEAVPTPTQTSTPTPARQSSEESKRSADTAVPITS